MNPFSGLIVYDTNASAAGGGCKSFVLNDQKIAFNKDNNQSLFSVHCRSDVSSFVILDLVDQILISLSGGMVTKHGEYDADNEGQISSGNTSSTLTFMEIVSPKLSNEVAWSSIRVYLGTNKDKQRVLYVLMTSKAKDLQNQFIKDATAYGTSVVSQLNNAVRNRLANSSTAFNLLSTVTGALHLDSGENAVTNILDDHLTIEEILALPQQTFAEVNHMITQLFCVSLFEEYLSACFLGLFIDNKSEKWLQQYIVNISTYTVNINASKISDAIYSVYRASREAKVNVPVANNTLNLVMSTVNAEVTETVFKPFDEDVRNDKDEGDQKVILKTSTCTDICNTFDINSAMAVNPIGSDANAIVVNEYFGADVKSDKWYECSNKNPPEVLKSIIDVSYVRDVQRTFAYDLRYTLGVTGDALDSYVLQVERSCAKLMTTLKGMYLRSGVDKPIPPESKPLTDYPLHLPTYVTSANAVPPATEMSSGTSIIDSSLDIASMLIYKARKHQMQTAQKFKHILHTAAAACLKAPFVDLSSKQQELLYMMTHIEDVLYGVFNQLQTWAKDEALIRLDRKILAISERIRAIEGYKYQLIHNLQNRTNSLLGVHMTAKADKDALAQFKDKFRFINEDEEPVLFESPATINGRSGMLYITCGHICFQSNYALLHETLVLVIMWKVVVSVQLGDDIVQLDSPMVETSSFTSTSSNVITIGDSSGKNVLISLVGATPDYASRVFALMVLLLQSKYYQLLDSGNLNSSTVDNYLSLENTVKRMKDLVLKCLKTEVAKSSEQNTSLNKVPKDYIALAIISSYEQHRNACVNNDSQSKDNSADVISSSIGTDNSLLSTTPPSAPSSSWKQEMSYSPAKVNSFPLHVEESHTGSVSTDALLEWESEDILERPSVSTTPPPLMTSIPPPPPPVLVAHNSPIAPPISIPATSNDNSEKKPTKLQSNIQVCRY